MITKKMCLTCGRPVSGRSDKKFCDDYCRNGYHNQRASALPDCIRKVNSILSKNRSILESVCREITGRRKMIRISRLQDAGFRFAYFTYIRKGPRGHTWFYCYDHGFRTMEGGRFLLITPFLSDKKPVNNI